jgi:hypothetical protein
MKIISGFQTGADIAGIRAAKDCLLETGGYMPKGYKTEKGNKPEYKSYGALEHSNHDYLGRTLKNVLSSDATIIFDYQASSGSKKTKYYCSVNDKPYLYLNKSKIDSKEIEKIIYDFIISYNIINIAGNRESVASGIEKKVYKILKNVFSKINGL